MSNCTPSTKEEAIRAFNDWINQRPNLDYHNYGSRTAYAQEQRMITRQLHRARVALIRFATLPYDRDHLDNVMHGSFSGRLIFDTIGVHTTPHNALTYTTGQYWPTEYRLAAAVVLEDYNGKK